MTIESITLGQIAVLVAFVVALIKGLDFLKEKYRKPTDDLEERIDERLKKIESDNKMTLKIVYSLLQHQVTGDHNTDMERLYSEMSNYIIDK